MQWFIRCYNQHLIQCVSTVCQSLLVQKNDMSSVISPIAPSFPLYWVIACIEGARMTIVWENINLSLLQLCSTHITY